MKKVVFMASCALLVGCGGGGGRAVNDSGSSSQWAGSYTGTSHGYHPPHDERSTATMQVSSTGQTTISFPNFLGVNWSCTGTVDNNGTWTGTNHANGQNYTGRGTFTRSGNTVVVRIEQYGVSGNWGGVAELRLSK